MVQKALGCVAITSKCIQIQNRCGQIKSVTEAGSCDTSGKENADATDTRMGIGADVRTQAVKKGVVGHSCGGADEIGTTASSGGDTEIEANERVGANSSDGDGGVTKIYIAFHH